MFVWHIGGPKLRKWYGAPDLLEKDENELNEDEAQGLTSSIYLELVTSFVDDCVWSFTFLDTEEDEVRDAVLVTDGDNEIGQVM